MQSVQGKSSVYIGRRCIPSQPAVGANGWHQNGGGQPTLNDVPRSNHCLAGAQVRPETILLRLSRTHLLSSGAGKTTVLSMLVGMYPPTAGTAKVNGHDITTNMEQVRALKLALVPSIVDMTTVTDSQLDGHLPSV